MVVVLMLMFTMLVVLSQGVSRATCKSSVRADFVLGQCHYPGDEGKTLPRFAQSSDVLAQSGSLMAFPAPWRKSRLAFSGIAPAGSSLRWCLRL